MVASHEAPCVGVATKPLLPRGCDRGSKFRVLIQRGRTIDLDESAL